MLYPLSHRREVGMGLRGVIDGFRTRDNRSHNPMLYQLSYGHRHPGWRRSVLSLFVKRGAVYNRVFFACHAF